MNIYKLWFACHSWVMLCSIMDLNQTMIHGICWLYQSTPIQWIVSLSFSFRIPQSISSPYSTRSESPATSHLGVQNPRHTEKRVQLMLWYALYVIKHFLVGMAYGIGKSSDKAQQNQQYLGGRTISCMGVRAWTKPPCRTSQAENSQLMLHWSPPCGSESRACPNP